MGPGKSGTRRVHNTEKVPREKPKESDSPERAKRETEGLSERLRCLRVQRGAECVGWKKVTSMIDNICKAVWSCLGMV